MNVGVGSEFREARKRRELSIEQLSAVTKITVPVLRAIENDDIARLPGGVFTRGFLHAYAREVGLDPGASVTRYLAQFDVPQAVDSAPDASRQSGPRLLWRSRWTPPLEEDGRTGWILATVSILAIGAVLLLFTDFRSSKTDEAVHEVVASRAHPVDTVADDAPVGTTGEGTAAAAIGGSQPRLRVELRADAPAWVTAHADGRRVTYRLMQQGERQTIEASREVVVLAGDAANLAVTVNDVPRPRLGNPGQVVKIRFTPEQ